MGPSPVDEIKSRLDILEVIGSYIKVSKAGRNYKARCPFHSEKTPSFMVSPERQIWHCFGCGLGGDIFAFVKQIEGIEFGDALRLLANRAGVVLKRQDPVIQTKRRRIYEICELAAKFFEKQRESKTGKKAYNYLIKERGVKNQTIKEWRLGWAPDEWRSLSEFLQSRGYKDDEILQAGLTVEPQNDGKKIQGTKTNYDRFRSRIIFPLFDIQGQIVGFAGRIFGKDDSNVGKYINTPQTMLYDKSRLLYGLNFAKVALREKNLCVFVEGNLDIIMSHQAGIKNTVATSGTALTPEHLKIINRYTENIVFAFDTDAAGETATKRSIDMALENDFNVRIAQMSQKDPADLIKQNPSTWEKAINQAISVMDYYFKTVFAPSTSSGQAHPTQLTPEEKKQAAKVLLPIIKKIPNQIVRGHWIGEAAKKLKTDEKILYAEMEKAKLQPSAAESKTAETPAAPQEKSRTDELEERLLSLFLTFPEILKNFNEEAKDYLSSEKTLKILTELKSSYSPAKKDKCLDILKKKLPEELRGQVDCLSFKNEQFGIDEAGAQCEINECLQALKVIKIKEQMAGLTFEIREAQQEKNKKKLHKILKKFNGLSNKLLELTNDHR
ncbi:MAG: DNA primase [Candidatus Portnoybacteria bacterium RBG_19FT_COMBO_36_7]|uniref:DNA primase n=1 Tax=Candidatus Portnoybacteria bacterium RBG_19FT_COMBO_36_7 TaxID=1801992 RepID=A0A1G2F895_9BACT|nr:MAG: DNA primase [Candidatus Portnoybacteria bacterium RBG_19FT_COMBO_36_7]